MAVNYISMTTSSGTAWLSYPEIIEYKKSKQLSRLYFWSSTTVIDRGKSSEEIYFSGREVFDSDATSERAIVRLSNMEKIVQGGYPVQVGRLQDNTYNVKYQIKSFDYGEAGGYPGMYGWTLSMEKVAGAIVPPPASTNYTHMHTEVLAFGEHASATTASFPYAFPLDFIHEF